MEGWELILINWKLILEINFDNIINTQRKEAWALFYKVARSHFSCQMFFIFIFFKLLMKFGIDRKGPKNVGHFPGRSSAGTRNGVALTRCRL